MGLSQERSLIIDVIALISWDMHLVQELFSIGIHNIIFISTLPTLLGLININIFSPQNTNRLLVIYSFNNTLKVFSIIRICST